MIDYSDRLLTEQVHTVYVSVISIWFIQEYAYIFG